MVELTDGERQQLQELTGSGNARVRRVERAQILLAAQQGHPDAVIAQTVAVGTSTVYRTKRRFVECALEGALSEDPPFELEIRGFLRDIPFEPSDFGSP